MAHNAASAEYFVFEGVYGSPMEECIDASKVGHQVFGDVNDMKDYIVSPKE